MAGLLDVLQTPQGFGLLLSGVGSAVSGDPSHLQTNVQIQRGMADLAARRQEMDERQRRADAVARLPSLMAPISEEWATPEMMANRQSQMVGLLGEISPDMMAHGLIGSLFQKNETQDPSAIREMRALDIPLTKEGFAAYNQLKGSDGQGIGMNPLQQAQFAKIMSELNATGEDRREAKAEKDRNRARSEYTLNQNLGRMNELAGYAEYLDNTFLKSGAGASDWRRVVQGGKAAVQEALGLDASESQKITDTYDKLNKGLSDLIIDSAGQFSSTLTDSKLSLLQKSMASPNVSTNAIRTILGGLASDMRADARIRGYMIEDEKGLDSFITRMKTPLEYKAGDPLVDVPGAVEEGKAAASRAVEVGKEAAGKASDVTKRAVIRAADIGRMTMDQIEKLDLEALSDEAFAEVKRRYGNPSGKK